MPSHSSNIAGVHIISHGDAGSIQLGDTVLNAETLSTHADEIQQWGQSLSNDADLLLYGCNVASGEDGLAFVNQIGQLTQADVAASDDITGQGGDWNLEVTVGNLETDLIINPNNQPTYQGSLAIYKGNEYVLTNGAKTWEEAQVEAEALGGNLVTINDAAEEAWLQETFTKDEELWIGINDIEVEGQFEWSSGETVTYTNWAPGEPSNSSGNQDFGSMNYGTNHQWDDSSPNAKLQGIIEIESPSLGFNIVVNGSFENNSITSNRWGIVNNLEGWTPSIQSGIEVQELTNLFGNADDGTAWVELDSRRNGGIVQSLQTTPKTSYQLSFALSPRPNVSSASNGVEVYWNGKLIDNISRQGESSNSWKTYTYNLATNSNTTALEFRGTGTSDGLGSFIDDVKVQATNGDSNEPQPDPDPTDGLVGYWQFNEISPNTQIIDASGNNNNATYVNVNPGITSYSGPINSAPIFEDFNPRSGNFDGINDYASIGNSPELNNSDGTFTQSAWIRPTATDNGFHGILGHQDRSGAVNRAPSLWSYDQTKIHAGFGDGTNWNSFVTGDVLKLNEWNHVVSSFDGNDYKIYVDGEEVFSTDDFAGRKPTNVQRLDIGRVDNYFKGQIDEVRVYNRTLDSKEIEELYYKQPNKAQVGDWSIPINFPNIPVAAAVLPNGKVVTWSSWDKFTFGGNGPQRSYTSIWDPETGKVGEVLVTNTNHDMFCPGIAMLPDGKVLVNGGGEFVRSTSIYDFETGRWSDSSDMNYRRWYNSSLTLGNGDIFTIGGERDSNTGGRITTGVGEIWNKDTGWRTLSGAPIAPIANAGDRGAEHPQIFLAPNGKVFAAGASPTMYWYDINGKGVPSEAKIIQIS